MISFAAKGQESISNRPPADQRFRTFEQKGFFCASPNAAWRQQGWLGGSWNCLTWCTLGLQMLHSPCKISQRKGTVLLDSFVTELPDQRYQNEQSSHRHEEKCFLSDPIYFFYAAIIPKNHFCLYKKIGMTNSSDSILGQDGRSAGLVL